MKSDKLRLYIIKAVLIFVGMAFCFASKSQNILANPEFDDMIRNCETNDKLPAGWYNTGASYVPLTIKKRNYISFGSTNYNLYLQKRYSFLIGSMFKPVRKDQTYRLRMKLGKKKKTLNLYYAFSKNFNYNNNTDTIPIVPMTFKQAHISNKNQFELDVIPDTDSANYIVIKMENLQKDTIASTSFLIDSIELIDRTEHKRTLQQKYYSRIKEIYSDRRRLNFTAPCDNQTGNN